VPRRGYSQSRIEKEEPFSVYKKITPVRTSNHRNKKNIEIVDRNQNLLVSGGGLDHHRTSNNITSNEYGKIIGLRSDA
jgi:hypothetical protein